MNGYVDVNFSSAHLHFLNFPLSVLRIRVAEMAAGVPLGTLIAMGRDAPGILYHAGHVQKVPGHERGVAVSKIAFRAARTGIHVGRARADPPQPGRICLGWDHVTQVLHGIEYVHGAVLGAILVPCDETSSNPPIVGVLAMLIEISG